MRKYKLNKRIVAIASLAFCIVVIFTPYVYAEETDSKWYLGAKIPIMFLNDSPTDTKTNSTGALSSNFGTEAVTGYSTGFRVSGAIGYQVEPTLRIESELFFSEAKVDKLVYGKLSCGGILQAVQSACNKIGKISDTTAGGTAEQQGVMINAWYDVVSRSQWTPYFGGGIGFMDVDIGRVKWDPTIVSKAIAEAIEPQNELEGFIKHGLALSPVPRTSTSDTVIAYQIGAGLEFQFDDFTTIDLGYRYQITDTVKYSGNITVPRSPSSPDTYTIKVESETKVELHLLLIGIRRYF